MKRLLALLALGFAFLAGPALATNCPAYPYTLTNGQTADANQVMANFNSIQTCANNIPIVSVPVAVASGGTGATNGAGAATNLGVLSAANNLSDVASLTASLSNIGGAPIASPTFTGVPLAPTAAGGTNTTQIATTAFVHSYALLTDSRFVGPTQNGQCTYGLLITDAGGQIYCNTAGTHTLTIPANASVAFVVVTKIEVANDCSAGAMTIVITTDTLVWFPSGGTGSRTLAACGLATLTKVGTTRWVITGTGLT